ncbi:ABC transporter substrate-binding protein [Parasediminibacterium paludis]|uniref:ABC transporter substrate-binding protein n=1 Tax=Parasediminibacterium paludis TaxID=908966 RepID=A0ABV8Q0A6_9BACT
MFESIDQLGRKHSFENRPKHIVSLVPSQTELLHDLGLENEVVGITKFCIHPTEWFNNKPSIGGTKNVKMDAVKALQPDLIIANKEENVKEQIEALEAIAPVWVSDVNHLKDALAMIEAIGNITNTNQKAQHLIKEINSGFNQLKTTNTTLKTAYLIWRKPYMTVGGDTYINDMLQYAGFENVFANEKRYPAITIEQITEKKCDLLLLSSEPYPFKQQHIEALQAALPRIKIVLVDGEMFSWYGSRLIAAASYFKTLQETIRLH